MELKQVFDASDMPGDIQDELAVFYEVANDSYHRWYPKDDWNYPGAELKKRVNEWLRANGMEEDLKDEYFNVLIRFSW